MKISLKKVIILMFAFSMIITSCFANEIKISGKIDKVANDFTSIIIDGKEVFGPADEIEAAMFEVGDKVEVTAKEKDGKIILSSYEYAYEDIE